MRRTKIGAALALLPLLAGSASAQDASGHVPPEPPTQAMPAMGDAQMASVMEMDDDAKLAMFKADELETGRRDGATQVAWNLQASWGGDFDKLWLRSEGERGEHATDARVEALWDHAFANWWDWQVGLREDLGSAPGRSWAAFGVRGITPWWLDVEATAYVGKAGGLAGRLRVDYDVLLTQRLVLQPEVEINAYARNDRTRERAAGLSDAQFGLRLRYEWRREFAPYVGVVRGYRRSVAGLADSHAPSRADTQTRLVAGVCLWF